MHTKFFFRSSEEKGPNKKLRNTQENNIKMGNRKVRHGLHSSSLGELWEDDNIPLSYTLFTSNLKTDAPGSS
jgi:hypothetical protein